MPRKIKETVKAFKPKADGCEPSVLSDLLAAIDLLTEAIGCYGIRLTEEISIHWGNGLMLRKNGVMQAAGKNNIAKAIAEIKAANAKLTSGLPPTNP